MVRLSVLDLAPITEGSDAATALRNTLDLARHAERLGFHRYWLAEHHNMPGIASAATAVVIAHVAAGTHTIRVGAGGIMLPNHAPLVVAEQFGTLESLFPGRIDLGLGRAPGTDPATAHALRRTLPVDPDAFPQDVLELMAYFAPRGRADRSRGSRRRARRADLHPGIEPVRRAGRRRAGAAVRVRLALRARADDAGDPDLSRALPAVGSSWQSPTLMLGINVVAAATDDEARFLATSRPQSFASLRRGMPTTLPPPNRDFEKDVVPFGRIRWKRPRRSRWSARRRPSMTAFDASSLRRHRTS